jgi:cytochrome d ubiquinol oxidase subunit I
VDITALSRLQFALTTVYHFFFVPLTLGLSVIVAIMETMYIRNKDEMYKKMTQFFGNLFIINFAMGVVSGIVMEFQFGMNWSEYARYVGDVFGAPLAIESLLAFFLESVFLGLWIFGWERLPKGVHLAAIWIVAIASSVSAFWILSANSFMQHPVGYAMLENGRILMQNFGALIGNPYLWLQFPHVLLAGFSTGAFFVLGVSAYHLLRKREVPLFTQSFKIAAIIGLISIAGVIFLGDRQGKQLNNFQPMKTAANEGLWETENPASFAILAFSNEEEQKETWSIRVPAITSFLIYSRFSGEVKGINDLQKEYVAEFGPGTYFPNVPLVFYSFRLMVGFGFLMLLAGLIAVYWLIRKKPLESQRLLVVFPFLIALPYLSNIFGWIVAESGRQPWVVWGLLKTQDAVSPNLTSGMVLASLILFILVYVALMAADVYLLVKTARKGAGSEAAQSDTSKA